LNSIHFILNSPKKILIRIRSDDELIHPVTDIYQIYCIFGHNSMRD